jgi:RND family efflux transporter MFP subunit
MKVKHWIALILAGSFFSVPLTYSFMKSGGLIAESLAAVKSSPALPQLITTARPARRSFTLSVPWIGIVESQASVELTAMAAGRIEVIAAEDQTRIKEGQLVMRLGGPQVEEIRAKLAAEIKSLQSELDLARQTVKRRQQSLTAHLATKDEVAAAQDSQIKLQDQLSAARLNLKTFENQVCISAPFNGTFTNRRVSVGQNVSIGMVVGEIIDTDRLRIVASIFPPQGIALQDREATIHLDQNRTLTALVRQVMPRAGNTGALEAWIEGPQVDEQLRPGQAVAGSVVLRVGPESLAVPESAIVYDSEEHPYLFVQKGDAYEPLRVRLGLIRDGWVEVLAGLETDQTVVIKGAYELFYRQFNEQFKVQD